METKRRYTRLEWFNIVLNAAMLIVAAYHLVASVARLGGFG